MAQMVKIYSASQINISYSSLPKRKPWIGLPHEKDQGVYFSTFTFKSEVLKTSLQKSYDHFQMVSQHLS